MAVFSICANREILTVENISSEPNQILHGDRNPTLQWYRKHIRREACEQQSEQHEFCGAAQLRIQLRQIRIQVDCTQPRTVQHHRNLNMGVYQAAKADWLRIVYGVVNSPGPQTL